MLVMVKHAFSYFGKYPPKSVYKHTEIGYIWSPFCSLMFQFDISLAKYEFKSNGDFKCAAGLERATSRPSQGHG